MTNANIPLGGGIRKLKVSKNLFRCAIFFSIVLGSFFVFGVGKAWAATFYVSQAGVDTDNGTSSSTPWKHHPWDANATNTALATVLQGDDVVYMRRGDTWYDCYLNANDVGSINHQITTTSTDTFYKTSSSDALPKLSGAYDPSTLQWTNTSGTIYSAPATTKPNIVVYNDTVLILDTSTSPSLNNWYWVSNVLYVNVGENPATGILEAGKRNGVYSNTQGYQTLSYLELRVTNSTTGTVFSNTAKASIIGDHLIIKRYPHLATYQYNNTGCQITNSIVVGTGSDSHGIFGNNVPGIIVTGNTVTNVSASKTAIYVTGNSIAANISNNNVNTNAGSGINLGVGSDGSIVYNNSAHDNCSATYFVCAGIFIVDTSSNTIYNNTVYNNTKGYYPTGFGSGISVSGSAASNLIYNNNIYNNYIGIMSTITSGAAGNRYSYNIVRNSTVNGIDVTASGTGYEFVYNNTVIHSPSVNNSTPYKGHGIVCQTNCVKTVIANNSVLVDVPVLSTYGEGIAIANSYNGVRIDYNNIFIKNGTGYGQVGQISGTVYDTFAAWKAAAQADAKILDLTDIAGQAEAHSIGVNPLFVSSSDFHLQSASPAIDSGTDVGLTTDYTGINPIYGFPDIGAYEYQPTKEIGTDTVYKEADVTIYGDEKFHNRGSESGGAVDFSLTIPGSTKTDYVNVDISVWSNDGNHHKNWTESSTVSGLTNTVHTVGDLLVGHYYNVKLDNVLGQHISGINCTSGVCLANGTGKIIFTYIGAYSDSDHTFDIADADTTPPVLSFTDNVASGPTLSDTISADWGDSSIKKWKYNDNTTCSAISTDHNKTNSDSMNQTTETNNTKYICLYGEDTAGNISTMASTNDINIDITSPTLFSLNPDNQTLNVSTTSTSLTLTTSETATCKYSTTSGTAYADMVTFNVTNCTSHSTPITGLNTGTTYIYYLKCQDIAGNESGESSLSFSIAPEEHNISLNSVKVKIERTWNKFKDTIHSKKKKLKLKSEDSQLANGQVKIYADGKRIETIDINSSGAWDYLLKLKDNANKIIKLKFFDSFGTLLGTKKAKVEVDTQDPAFILFPPDNKLIYTSYQREENRALIYQAKDNQGIDHYKIEWNGKITDKKTYGNQGIQSFLAPKDTPKGIHTFKVIAYDEAGNKESKEVDVVVR